MTEESIAGEPPIAFASLRVMGTGLDFEGISSSLGLSPTVTRRAGDRTALGAQPTDIWLLESPLDKKEPLEAHLKWLRATLMPHYQFILSMRPKARVDIYCGLTLYREQNGLQLAPEALKLFVELDTPLDISILAILPD